MTDKTIVKNRKMLLYAGFLVLLTPILFWAIKAICAGSASPFTLFMDERITYEPIHKALVGTWFDLFAFFFDGHDNRYGRLLWNINFITSYIPYQVFGDQGQIIATRLTQALILLSGYILIVWSVVKSWWLRILCLISVMLLPETFYYLLMPKPEPLMVLTIGALIYTLLKHKEGVFFLLVGVLAGLKISALPICIIFLAAYWIYHVPVFSFKALLIDLKKLISIKVLVIFCLIFCISAVFLNYYIQSVYADEIYKRLNTKKILGLNIYYCFVVINSCIASFFIFVTALFASSYRKKLSKLSLTGVQLLAGLAFCSPYLYFTPFNFILYLTTPVSHGADQSDLNAVDWIKHIYREDFFGQPLLLISLFVGVMILVVCAIKYKTRILNIRSIVLLLFILFIINLFPIIFLTKRLWGFYLLLPMLFLFVGYMAATDRIKSLPLKIMSALLFLIYPFWALPMLLNKVQEKRNEQHATSFITRKKEYVLVCDYINQKVKEDQTSEKKAFWDPNLFFPDMVKMKDVKIFWGPFNGWSQGRDFVVLSGYPDNIYKLDPENKNYDRIKESISQFHIFTDSLTGSYREYKKDSFVYYKIFIKKE
jgi:hypothetical protein